MGVCNIVDLTAAESREILSFDFNRRPYYSIILLHGSYEVDVEDKTFTLQGHTLLYTTPKIPFGIRLNQPEAIGASCVFTEPFVTKMNSGFRLQEFPIYKPGQQLIYSLSEEQAAPFVGIFEKMFDEKLANTAFKEQMLRTYLLQLIFTGQRLTPSASYIRQNNTAEEIACSFVRLLEGQFPVESPQDMITLTTPKDFADRLAIHPVYLNRQVKTSKNRTVSDMIAARIMQEAKVLLKLNNWQVAEIAYSLGFEEPSHFNNFFKKHMHISPTDYRNGKV